MAKIIRTGDRALPLDPPTAGLKGHCSNCGTDIETEDEEESYQPTIVTDGEKYIPGWNIPCPAILSDGNRCKSKIFIEMPR